MTDSSFLPRRQPFIYLLTAFVAGILAENGFAPSPALALLGLIGAILFSVKGVVNRKAATGYLLIGFVCLGVLLARAENGEVSPGRLTRLFEAHKIPADEAVELSGVLVAPPEPAPGGLYLDIEAESLRAFAEPFATSGRARLAIWLPEKESEEAYHQLGLDYGSRLRVMVKLERARVYKNPGAIDFNDFLERQGYDLKGTIKSPLLIEARGRAPVNRILDALYRFRLQLLQAIDARFQQPEAGTLKAMILGNRYFLDPETSEALRQSSTFHALVISGMHFGLLAFALLRIRLPVGAQIRNVAKSKWPYRLTFYRRPAKKGHPRPGVLRFLLAFSVLWAYALLVGLAPPVTRAVLMISIALIAPRLFRQAPSLNTLALAAFLMLALKPSLVADPGFQLSFIAVAAIVTIALPVAGKLRAIGAWRPSPESPHPPLCGRALRGFCELLFWDERAFKREMHNAMITYQVDKSPTSRLLSRSGLQWWLRSAVILLITSTAIQLLTLPLMVFYFNRVAPVGILLNILSGLLTGVIMLAALLALVSGAVNFPSAPCLFKSALWTVKTAHYVFVNSINPFLKVSGMTFRTAHFQGWQASLYALYFLPIAALIILIDVWEPLRNRRQKAKGKRQNEAISDREIKRAESADKDHDGQTRSWKRPLSCALFLALLLAIVAVINPPARLEEGKLTIYFLDVGQGDSALVIFPHGSTMLIDGGGELSSGQAQGKAATADPANLSTKEPFEQGVKDKEEGFKGQGFAIGEVVVSRFLWSLGLTKIDYLLATHADADHIQGLSRVARNFEIGEALVGRLAPDNAEFTAFAQSTGRRNAPLAMLTAGQRYEIEGVSIEVLWPPTARPGRRQSGNNDSLVLRLRYGANAILFTGDIEREGEEGLLKSGASLGAEILKVPHHGSKTSSSAAFLDAVRPRLAIISVGEHSRFGHPHAVVVERYDRRGIGLLQTGRDGLICVQSDGQTLRITRQENPYDDLRITKTAMVEPKEAKK
jgi:competence protein ComEC